MNIMNIFLAIYNAYLRIKGYINIEALSFIAILVFSLIILRHSFDQKGIFLTHDSNSHIIRAIHFVNELNRGQFPVRMAADLAYKHSYPVFQFFYPLPYYIVSIFHLLGFSIVDGWRLSLVFVTFFSIYFFYRWLRCMGDAVSALMGAFLYAIFPFRFLTLYVTGQIGGYYSLLFVPLICWGLYLLLSKNDGDFTDRFKSTKGGLMISLGIFGFITSHLISLIIFFIPVLSITLYYISRNFNLNKVKALLLWGTLGFGISAFYWLPFILEKSWVKLGNTILINHRDHWPSLKQLIYSPWGYYYSQPGPNDGMSFQVGIFLLLILVISIVLFLIIRKKKNGLWGFILIINCIFLFILMLDVSGYIWEIITPLQYIQYPWRILASLGFTLSSLGGWLIYQLQGKLRIVTIIALVILAGINVRNYMRPWPLSWKSDQEFINDAQAFYGSTDISWELMPVTTQINPSHIDTEIKTDDPLVNIFNVQRPAIGSTRLSFSVSATNSAYLTLPVWNYPQWHVYANNSIQNKFTTSEGKIMIKVPPSTNNRIILILMRTNIQKWADFISLFSVIVLLGICFKSLCILYPGMIQSGKQ